jgi:hypothetical protein
MDQYGAPRNRSEISYARWVLECAGCATEFAHSDIHDDGYSPLDPFTLTSTKPEFPKDGLSVLCPNCKNTFVYQRYQLLYREL